MEEKEARLNELIEELRLDLANALPYEQIESKLKELNGLMQSTDFQTSLDDSTNSSESYGSDYMRRFYNHMVEMEKSPDNPLGLGLNHKENTLDTSANYSSNSGQQTLEGLIRILDAQRKEDGFNPKNKDTYTLQKKPKYSTQQKKRKFAVDNIKDLQKLLDTIKEGKVPGQQPLEKVYIVTNVGDTLVNNREKGISKSLIRHIGKSEGDIGDIIEEQPLVADGDEPPPPPNKAGDGSGEHHKERDLYEIGKRISEKFDLPNLKAKSKKKQVPNEYTYKINEITRGIGLKPELKDTLTRVMVTNILMGNIDVDLNNIDLNNKDLSKIIIPPEDKVYRSLSQDPLYRDEAMVFFIRDYSGSMEGNPAQIVCRKHQYMNAWLNYRYKKFVTSRYILHESEAVEVDCLADYCGLSANGGTSIHSAFDLVNKIVDEGKLDRKYNIYVFYGGDGEDSTYVGMKEKFLDSLTTTMKYASYIGFSIVPNATASIQLSSDYIKAAKSLKTGITLANWLENSGLLKYKNDLGLYLFPPQSSADMSEKDMMDAIKELVTVR